MTVGREGRRGRTAGFESQLALPELMFVDLERLDF
jgi:hypothetical protein